MVEFDCVDCHQHIIAFGMNELPADGRCGVCQMIAEIPDPNEREEIRQRLEEVRQ